MMCFIVYLACPHQQKLVFSRVVLHLYPVLSYFTLLLHNAYLLKIMKA